MNSKWLGSLFLALGLLAMLVFIGQIWKTLSAGELVAAVLIPALKYWAVAELASGLGIVFLAVAPAQDWDWQTFFALAWWQDEWLTPGFRILLLAALLFLIGALVLDFGYKLFLAAI